MAKAILVKQKKKGRPSKGGADPIIGVRIPAALIVKLDAWGEAHELSRSEAVRQAIEALIQQK